MRSLIIACIAILMAFLSSCSRKEPGAESPDTFLTGADLSYVNELEDAGAVYRKDGRRTDSYRLFSESGCGWVRLRLWHTPSINTYSGTADVKRSIRRAKDHGMKVLLDLHYSDIWADPHRQDIPAAWKDIRDQQILGDSIYRYTFQLLTELHREGLLPEMVQTGNEINSEVMRPAGSSGGDIDWKRNAFLLNSALRAVREASKITGMRIRSMLHIAQPENAVTWFAAAEASGVSDHDLIGISYYPLWSKVKMDSLAAYVRQLTVAHRKPVIIVETAYPHTLQNADAANNILGDASLLPAFPATPAGQLGYLNQLVREVKAGGGIGIFYWEPAWVTSQARTPWAQGSHWDNATFFDAAKGNEALPAFEFFRLR
jgi:arabinogalactan endo-1,4-beta-galactosidase